MCLSFILGDNKYNNSSIIVISVSNNKNMNTWNKLILEIIINIENIFGTLY